jgi:hypothetical protein
MQDTQKPNACGTVAKWLDIRQQFPELRSLGELKGISTVYYPIALLKMRLEEYSFEDFNAVEQALLRFYSCGITSPQSLSKWMALSSVRYIQERLSLMEAEGLISGGTITSLGAESLSIGQKKQLYDAQQIFQADGIMGLLLPRAYQIKEDHLTPKSKTVGMIPHLAPSEAILVDQIKKAIEGPEKIRDYKRYRKSILNVNVHQVTDVQFGDLRYIKAILAWPEYSRAPLLFLPVYKRSAADGKRQCDTPLYIPESAAGNLGKLSGECEVVQDWKLEPLTQLYSLMEADQAALPLESIARWIREHTAFTCRSISLRGSRITPVLDLKQDAALGPCDLELLAAMGTTGRTGVEVEAEIRNDRDQSFTKRLTLWPEAGEIPRADAQNLARCWVEHHRKFTEKNRVLTLQELQTRLTALQKEAS